MTYNFQDRYLLRALSSDDHDEFEVIHEGDDVVEYDDIVLTLIVTEHKATGVTYGIQVIRQGNYEDPVWEYEFLGVMKQKEVITIEWVPV